MVSKFHHCDLWKITWGKMIDPMTSYDTSLGMVMSLKPVLNQMMLTRLWLAHHKWTWSFLHWLLCTPWLKMLINQNMLSMGGIQPESRLPSSLRLVNVDVGFPRTSWSRSVTASGPFQKLVRMLCCGAFSQKRDHLGELGVLKDPTTSDGCFFFKQYSQLIGGYLHWIQFERMYQFYVFFNGHQSNPRLSNMF